MVAKPPALPTLVWEAGVQDPLLDRVGVGGSFRHGRDHDESREPSYVLDLYCHHGSSRPLDVRIGGFNVQDPTYRACQDGESLVISKLLVQIRELHLDRVCEEHFCSLHTSIEVRRELGEGETKSAPVHGCEFSCCNGSFLVLKENQEVASS